MSATGARQSQRVLLDVPVQLTLRDDTRTLPARALDLSEGGMRLCADTPLRVGDEVTCDLELDHEHAALSGRVRWSKPGHAQPGGAGAGVQWGELDEAQLGLLRRWLANNNEHAEMILLHVPGSPEPLRARGCVTAEGLQLIAALPQLSPGAEVEFQLGEHGARRLAKVERVDLRPGTEHAQTELAVRLQPSATARSRRNLVYGLETSDLHEMPDVLPPPARVPEVAADGQSAQHETLEIPKTTTSRLVAGSLLVIATAGAIIYLSNPTRTTRTSATHHTDTRAATDDVAPPPKAEAATSAMHTAQIAQPTVAAAQLAAAPATAAKPAPAAPKQAVEPQPSAAPESEALDEARLPALNSYGTKSEIFVPMQGTLNGLRSTQWTEPLAVVLELPDAHIDAPELLQGLRGGGVRRVRLDDTHPVPRLQIFLNTVAARFAARSVPHGLLVVLEHDLQPMPH